MADVSLEFLIKRVLLLLESREKLRAQSSLSGLLPSFPKPLCGHNPGARPSLAPATF